MPLAIQNDKMCISNQKYEIQYYKNTIFTLMNTGNNYTTSHLQLY